MSESNIITGQFVRISQTAATIGERMLAQIIDSVVIVCYFVLVSLTISKLNLSWTRSQVVFVIVVYLPALLYSFLFELLNNGQSIGKLVMKTRVVNKDGTTPTMGSYFMRWLLMGIDGVMGIGILAILLSKNSQRLGDLAAGTMVIKLNNYHKIQVSLDEFSYLSRNYQPVYAQAAELSLNQIDIIQRTLDSDYGPDRDQRIYILYNKVRAMLGIEDQNTAPEKFLYTIIRDYQHFALEVV
ncbi:MAG: RDD family protein [Prevotella sp.]|nr:RDD family protein [Prevotella sp.]